jgi:hypothetical protein
MRFLLLDYQFRQSPESLPPHVFDAPVSISPNTTAAHNMSGPLPNSGGDFKIPHQLIFTYKWDILKEKKPPLFYQNVKRTIDIYSKAWGEPDTPVWFLSDDHCRRAIIATKPELLLYFNKEQDGSFKADICRVAALYLKGGYYFDVDMEAVQAFVPDSNVSFITAYDETMKRFFQSFLASEPGNRILREALDVMLNYYSQNKLRGDIKLGPTTLLEAMNAVPLSERGKTHLLTEMHLANGTYPDMPRRDGVGCCCNHVVQDSSLKQVFFYSRIVGAGKFCRLSHRLS